MRRRTIFFILALISATHVIFAQQPPDSMHHNMASMAIERAVAVLEPTEGNTVHGLVTFEAIDKGVQVVADVTGLTPGKHGFHVHEFGDCSARDGSAAGGHFNPGHTPHGAPTDEARHIGDLGNVTADSEGKAHLEWTDPQLSLNGPHSIIGYAVILHKEEDDLKSQPAGNAGARVACGVIGVAKK